MACLNEYSSNWKKQDRKKNPEQWKTSDRQLEWQRQDRINNPEKWKAYSKAHYDRHRDELIEKTKEWAKRNKAYLSEQNKHYGRYAVDNLVDRYIKYLIKGKGWLEISAIPEALIEVKRLQILINRRIKDENSNTITK